MIDISTYQNFIYPCYTKATANLQSEIYIWILARFVNEDHSINRKLASVIPKNYTTSRKKNKINE